MCAFQSCLTLCDPMDYSPPGSSVHGILQARILEWVARPSSRRSSQPREWVHLLHALHWQVGSVPPSPPWKPNTLYAIILKSYQILSLHFWKNKCNMANKTESFSMNFSVTLNSNYFHKEKALLACVCGWVTRAHRLDHAQGFVTHGL